MDYDRGIKQNLVFKTDRVPSWEVSCAMKLAEGGGMD